jgi:hypothetical protein
MSTSLREREPPLPAPAQQAPPYGPVRRLGSGIGLATILLLDLLALDDITTAGAWMPEIVFVIASVPALITLAYFLLRPSPALPASMDDAPRRFPSTWGTEAGMGPREKPGPGEGGQDGVAPDR